MILDRYFARRFLLSFSVIVAVFSALILLIDMIEQLRRFEGIDISFGQVVSLSLLSLPAGINEILPLIMILATIALFVALARSSELVVTRATGRSGIRALAAPVLVAVAIGALAVSTLNPIVAATSNRYQELAETYRGNGPSVVSLSGDGLWLRQGSAGGQAVIHATGYLPQTLRLLNVSILSFGPDERPVRRILAESAELDRTEWVLRKAKVWPLTPGLNPETSSAEHDTLRIPTTLTEERVRDSIGKPSSISIYDMPAMIRQLGQAGFSTTRQEVWFQSELARPLFLAAMVLIGAAFTMRHARLGGIGVSVLTSVLLGFGLYFIRNFAQVLGENGQLPVVLAAWAPPVAAILLSFGLLLHAEDG